MNKNCVFELSQILDSDKFERVFDECYCANDYPEEVDDELIDRSLEDKGLIVRYRASQFKKKIRLTVHSAAVTSGALSNPEKLVRKLDKLIEMYFAERFQLEDFTVSGMTISTDLDVGSDECLQEYLHVLKRIGKVKGFSPTDYESLEDVKCFCLAGNSNATDFLAYDLAQAAANGLKHEDMSRCQMKSVLKSMDGVLRIEIHLKKPKAVQRYTVAYSTADQITELAENSQKIFMETFSRVVPYGDFFKKGDAAEIIRREVLDDVISRKMLRLLDLIPEKKSLHLAQKSMSYRHPEKLLVEFAKIGLSPVTLSKRQNVKCLKNLYEFI